MSSSCKNRHLGGGCALCSRNPRSSAFGAACLVLAERHWMPDNASRFRHDGFVGSAGLQTRTRSHWMPGGCGQVMLAMSALSVGRVDLDRKIQPRGGLELQPGGFAADDGGQQGQAAVAGGHDAYDRLTGATSVDGQRLLLLRDDAGLPCLLDTPPFRLGSVAWLNKT